MHGANDQVTLIMVAPPRGHICHSWAVSTCTTFLLFHSHALRLSEPLAHTWEPANNNGEGGSCWPGQAGLVANGGRQYSSVPCSGLFPSFCKIWVLSKHVPCMGALEVTAAPGWEIQIRKILISLHNCQCLLLSYLFTLIPQTFIKYPLCASH